MYTSSEVHPSPIVFVLTRAVLLIGAIVAAYLIRPAEWSPEASAVAGATIAIVVIAVEAGIASRSSPIAGAAVGTLFGVAVGLPLALLVDRAAAEAGFLPLFAFLAPVYLGFRMGAAGRINLNANLTPMAAEVATDAPHRSKRILDTSVIIDGRIADIAATGFLEGTLVIPRFVLTELQQVADSQDSLKRARGRRGLDVLKRIQSEHHLAVQIVDDDFSSIREVDRKLIEVAKARRATLLTNDFNLNKVASLEGVKVLNINELAGALRPVALPGETMRVLIAREGKEHSQGVAYLDDGTMVVVENGRRAISKTVEVTVSSVLQTTAGKMIFARYDEKTQAVAS